MYKVLVRARDDYILGEAIKEFQSFKAIFLTRRRA